MTLREELEDIGTNALLMRGGLSVLGYRGRVLDALERVISVCKEGRDDDDLQVAKALMESIKKGNDSGLN